MAQDDQSAGTGKAPPVMPVLGGNPFFIGFRYLLTKKLSYLAIAGVMLSVATLVVVMSVMTGFGEQIRAVIRGYLSDLTVEPRTSRLYGLKGWEKVGRVTAEAEHVRGVAPYIEGYGLLKFRGSEHMEHVFFRGILPELEKNVTDIEQYLRKGTRLEGLEEQFDIPDIGRVQSCFIGNAMAEFVKMDFPFYTTDIILMTATGKLRPELAPFRVNGVFKTGRYDYDRMVVILSLEDAMKFVRSEGGVSGLSVKLDDYRNAPAAIEALQEKLGSDYAITTWEEKQQNFLAAVAMERFLMAVILSFIMILAGFCIFAVVTTTVYEKRKDIGILKAVGLTPAMIAWIFLFNGLAIGLIGAVLGVVGGVLFTSNINEIEQFIESATGFTPFPEQVYYFDRIPTDDSLLIPALVAGGAILCSLAFSLVPAMKAARLDPVQTLRFE